MAVNLGYAIGPAAGGFLAVQGYQWLFYVDGATCIAAGGLFAFYFLRKAPRNTDFGQSNDDESKSMDSPYRDFSFLMFGLLTASFALVFFQIFNTLPLYYRDVQGLAENQIGWLLALNGFIVFLVEMPLVYILGNRYSIRRVVAIGTLLTGVSFVLLNLSALVFILFISMATLSIAEILVMPYLTTYTVSKAGPKNRGKYLGFYAMTYSLAFIFAPLLGTYMIGNYGFEMLWYLMGIIGIFTTLGFLFNMREVRLKPDLAKAIEKIEESA
jgi:MFS family permease